MRNDDKKNIILTGFMATGKTSVGRTLADQLGYEFVDTDQIIESRIGMSIAQFFREKGEAAFRKMESELALELAEKRRVVIATGGRFMLNWDNAAALAGTGRVFCLVAAPEEILKRVEKDGNIRPLLQVPDPLGQIMKLLEERRGGYGQFPQVDTAGKSLDAVVTEIITFLDETGDSMPPVPPADRA